MPPVIAAFRASHPGVEVSLAEGEPEEIVPRLRAGEFDLALLFEFEGWPAPHRRPAPVRALRRSAPPRPPRRPSTRDRRETAAPRGPARGVLGADLGRQPLRLPRGPLLHRRGLRTARLLRVRRLRDGAGPGRRRGRRRADPADRALDRPRRHRGPAARSREPGAEVFAAIPRTAAATAATATMLDVLRNVSPSPEPPPGRRTGGDPRLDRAGSGPASSRSRCWGRPDPEAAPALTPSGYSSHGTSDGHTSCPWTAMSPVSISASLIRSGTNRPTSFNRMNVPIAEKPTTQAAA